MLASASGRATIAGTATLPLVSLYATAAVRPKITEIGLWNTTSAAVTLAVVRLGTTGTPGAAITTDSDDMPEQAPLATPFAGHTVAPTIGVEERRATLGAAVGSGVIWTWSEAHPLEIIASTTRGIGIIIPNGTGQILDFYFCWTE